MKTVAIVIDSWKLNTFKRILDEEGYDFSKHPGPTSCSLILKVKTHDLMELGEVMKKMNIATAN